MAIVQVTIIPVGTGTPSMSTDVSEALRPLQDEKELTYQLNSIGTLIEGDLDRILETVKRMHEAEFRKGVDRIQSVLIIDDRRDRPSSMSINR